MGQKALLPFRRKARSGFFRPEKSDGFGRVSNRELLVMCVCIYIYISGILGQGPVRCKIVLDNICLQYVKKFKYLDFGKSYEKQH